MVQKDEVAYLRSRTLVARVRLETWIFYLKIRSFLAWVHTTCIRKEKGEFLYDREITEIQISMSLMKVHL